MDLDQPGGVRMRVRLIRVDEGHYLVPNSDREVVREASGNWHVYLGNQREYGPFGTYEEARKWALGVGGDPV